MKPDAPATALEKLAIFATLWIMSGGLIYSFRPQAVDVTATEGERVTQILLGLGYMLFLFLMWRRRAEFLAFLKRDWFLVALVLLALASVAWSPNKSLTARRSIAVLGTTAVGIYAAARLSLDELMRLLVLLFGIATVASVLFSLALPKFGVDQSFLHYGAWKGIYTHKNTLGKYAAFASLLFLVQALDRSRGLNVGSAALFVVGFACMLFARSTTALVTFWGVAASLALAPFLRIKRIGLIYILVLGGIVFFVSSVVANWQYLMETVGKGPTLTGRLPVWFTVGYFISLKPAFGYGYGAFWLDWGGAATTITAVIGWWPSHSHNGLIETAANVGLVGLGLLLASVVNFFGNALKWYRVRFRLLDLAPLMILLFIFVYNLTETTFFRQNDVLWAIYVAFAFKAASHKDIQQGESQTAHI